MSRFLTISHGELTGREIYDRDAGWIPEIAGNSARVYGPQRSPGDAPLVAEFRDGMDAMRFLTAVALATNNPEARADYLERRDLYAGADPLGGDLLYVYQRGGENLIVATFAERADADLFVNFMRIG